MSILLEATNPANQLMGEILVTQQWITPSQLDAALSEQRRTNQKLGEILKRLGHVTEMELEFILSQQKGNTLTGESDNVKLRLGDILKKSGKVSPRNLSIAVDEQKKTNEKLGSVLTRLGLLSQDELGAVLAWQDDFHQADPLAVRLLLGEIMIASKRLSRKQLADALTEQKLTKKQIGQILVDAGHVTKFDLRNALKIQAKMVAAALLTMTAAMTLTGCGAPSVPIQPAFGTNVQYDQVNKGADVAPGSYGYGARTAQSFNSSAQYQVANLPGGHQLQKYADGSVVVGGVPFFKQAEDNTCAQASSSVVLNYWGIKMSYQEVVDQANFFNLPTTSDRLVSFLQSKGLKAKAYRAGNISFLHQMIDDGKPAIVMMEFNNSLFQQHYVTVVGYNSEKGTVIYHDSVDGAYRQLDEDTFVSMWQSKDLANLPILGGANYQGVVIDASK